MLAHGINYATLTTPDKQLFIIVSNININVDKTVYASHAMKRIKLDQLLMYNNSYYNKFYDAKNKYQCVLVFHFMMSTLF